MAGYILYNDNTDAVFHIGTPIVAAHFGADKIKNIQYIQLDGDELEHLWRQQPDMTSCLSSPISNNKVQRFYGDIGKTILYNFFT